MKAALFIAFLAFLASAEAVAVSLAVGTTVLTRLPLDPGNRMLRAGAGLHDGAWFVRVDLWWMGFRLTGARE